MGETLSLSLSIMIRVINNVLAQQYLEMLYVEY